MIMDVEDEVRDLEDDIGELQRQIDGLVAEERLIALKARGLDSGVRDWRMFHEASKFTGISVNQVRGGVHIFHLHPMHFGESFEAYSLTTLIDEKGGYKVTQCCLPESIDLTNLDCRQPLDLLLRQVSNLVDCFVNRRQQILQLENAFGDNSDRTISYSLDYLQAVLRIKVSDGSDGFMINIGLEYHSNEVLPYQVDLEVEGRELTEEEENDFQNQSHPFYVLPLSKAFENAFE